MPDGAVTLLEASRWDREDLLTQGVVETIIQESPLLLDLPFVTLNGEAFVARHEKELPGVEFRKVNETYTRNFGTFDKSTWGVSILGGEVFVDNFIVNTRSSVDDVKARQFRQKAKAAALTFDYYAIHGDGSADSFKGLYQMVADGWGQSLANAANGGNPDFDKFDEAIDLCRAKTPDAALMNRTVRRAVTKVARNFPGGYFPLIDVGTDRLGRQVTQYNGIPFKIIGDGPDGTQILKMNETQGGTANNSSILFVAYGEEENVTGILGANGMMDVKDFGETEAAPGHLGRIEFYPGMACLSKYALVRLTGVKLA